MEKFKTDMIGKKFGKLTVLKYSHTSVTYVRFWVCSCECGQEKIAGQIALKKGSTKSCGCLKESRVKNVNPGDRFGMLTIVEELPNRMLPSGQKQRYMLCRCDCGNFHKVVLVSLLHCGTVSCGCKFRTHGMTGTPIHYTWLGMKSRCYAPNRKKTGRYEDRGITVCDEWLNSFEKFHDWAIQNGYQKELELDRIDNDKGYSPDNCRFTTRIVNSNNRENTVYVNYKDEKIALGLLLRDLGLLDKYGAIAQRIKSGWDIERALITPLRGS